MQLMIENISKRYKGSDSYALRNLTLDIGPGILGLLGPNGAGKSTLMRIIATITNPTHGTVSWNGADIAQQPDEIRAVRARGGTPSLGHWKRGRIEPGASRRMAWGPCLGGGSPVHSLVGALSGSLDGLQQIV